MEADRQESLYRGVKDGKKSNTTRHRSKAVCAFNVTVPTVVMGHGSRIVSSIDYGVEKEGKTTTAKEQTLRKRSRARLFICDDCSVLAGDNERVGRSGSLRSLRIRSDRRYWFVELVEYTESNQNRPVSSQPTGKKRATFLYWRVRPSWSFSNEA